MEGFAHGVGKLDPVLEKGGASAAAFRTAAGLDREMRQRVALDLRQTIPPVI